MLAFDSYDCLLRVDLTACHFEAADDFLRVHGHDLLVYPEQRFTFRTIEKNVFRLCIQFDVGRESGAAGSDDPCVPYLIKQTHLFLSYLLKLAIFVDDTHDRGVCRDRVITGHSSS